MSQGPLLPNVDLVRRCQAITAASGAIRVGTIAARPGNPLGAEVRRYAGGALALRTPPFGEHYFNRAFGFTDETLGAPPRSPTGTPKPACPALSRSRPAR